MTRGSIVNWLRRRAIHRTMLVWPSNCQCGQPPRRRRTSLVTPRGRKPVTTESHRRRLKFLPPDSPFSSWQHDFFDGARMASFQGSRLVSRELSARSVTKMGWLAVLTGGPRTSDAGEAPLQRAVAGPRAPPVSYTKKRGGVIGRAARPKRLVGPEGSWSARLHSSIFLFFQISFYVFKC
jgi:hypothetical protein